MGPNRRTRERERAAPRFQLIGNLDAICRANIAGLSTSIYTLSTRIGLPPSSRPHSPRYRR